MGCGMPKPPLFFMSRRGLSQAITAILLILASVALMSIAFIFGNTLLQSQSRVEKITITDASIIKIGSSVIVRYSVGNAGTETLTLTLIKVEGTSCSQSLSQQIAPGQRFSDSFLCSVNMNIGEKYVVRAEARTSDNRVIGDAVWVRVSA